MYTEASALVRLHEITFGLGETDGLSPEEDEEEIQCCRSEIGPGVLARYEELARRYGENALVAVESTVCPGCNITLPSSVAYGLDEEDVDFCDYCGRILVSAEYICQR